MNPNRLIEVPGLGRVSLLDLEKYSSIDSLKTFVELTWSIVEPTTPLAWNWHLDIICSHLEAIHRGEVKNLIINVPPGTGKSFFTSVFFNAWEWASNPELRYLTASYTDDNPIRDNRRCRDIISSKWYKDRFGVQLSSDQAGKIRFDNTSKGWRIATSVGGMGTGEHPDRIIIDDPLKAEDARSETKLKACAEWFDRTISTRVARNPAMIVIMQRLHMEDLTGHLMSKGGWELIKFPMRYRCTRLKSDKDQGYQADPKDKRTIEGELLWPSLWPEDKVHREEILLGPFGSAGQLGQDPIPEGGGLFKRDWFDIVDAIPQEAIRCRGWDTADTPGGGNWTVGVKIAYVPKTGLFYIEDVQRDQLGPAGVSSLIYNTAVLDGKEVSVREGSGSGKATIASRTVKLAGWDYAPSPETSATGDKVSRSAPFRAQCEARNVKIKRADWNDAYLSVVCSFPVGKYDDDVDASAHAFNELVLHSEGDDWVSW
jgi:predicted phage terminase large subunit-like protein